MKTNLTPLNHFAEVLEPFKFPEGESKANTHVLEQIAAGLSAVVEEASSLNSEAVKALLVTRAQEVAEQGGAHYRKAFEKLVGENLVVGHSFTVLFANTQLVDALHEFVFQVAVIEMPLLLRQRILQVESQLEQRRVGHPLRLEKLAQLENSLDGGFPPEEEAYYRKVAADMRLELEEGEGTQAALELDLTALRAFQISTEEIHRRLVLFARGGYGRAELSFGSDIDTGYCLDNRGMVQGEVLLYQDLILRMESLLGQMGLETAHQYFEVNEDLSRFRAPETLHTIPAVLEARLLAGNAELLVELRSAFKKIMPFERLVRKKIEEFDAQLVPGLDGMNLKEDFGGLRSIQIPLWLLAFTHNASNYFTLDLLHLARQKQLLSLWEVTRLLRALEMIYELRNFVGGAEAHYFDRSALERGFVVHQFSPNRIDDALSRLYLFRKNRFSDMGRFEAQRLRLVEEVQRISRRLLERVLDRTVEQRLENFRVSVHLGHKRVIAVHSQQNGGTADLRTLFTEGGRLLELFLFVAETDYDLSVELRDGLSGNVSGLSFPVEGLGGGHSHSTEGRAAPALPAEILHRLMAAPYAHRAIAAMAEINDPLRPEMPTLLGRFIPGYDDCIYRMRSLGGGKVAQHVHMGAALEAGQRVLNELHEKHPEYYRMLGATELVALKWSLFLQGMTLPHGTDPTPGEAANAADKAVEILHGLGIVEGPLDDLVHLLIAHHNSLARLSKSATYIDQALARYLDLADRSLPRIILLYLANMAVLLAGGAAMEEEVAVLNELFDEADQMLMEIRGLPGAEQSLDVINRYFDHKKIELVRDTRLHWLLQQAIERGFEAAIFSPLQSLPGGIPATLEARRDELEQGQREMLVGNLPLNEQDHLEERLISLLKQCLGPDEVRVLTAATDMLFSWFFSAYPNRYLLATPPRRLAVQMAKFENFQEARSIVDVEVSGSTGLAGLLIFTQGLSRSHTRVAYAMSRNRLNISSGKVNRVEVGEGRHGYCYFFQISTLDTIHALDPRELEMMIVGEPPPALELPTASEVHGKQSRVKVAFSGDDHKGYCVEVDEGRFVRRDAEFHHLRMVMRDSSFLFYKASRVFDHYDVEIQQSLITTVGNQVVDYFYLTPEDYKRLEDSDFSTTFVNLVSSDVRDVLV